MAAGQKSRSLFSQILGAATPDIQCEADVIVLAVHSIVLGSGFACGGVGGCAGPDVVRLPSAEQGGSSGAVYQKVLPENWASASREGGVYNFEYCHPSWQWDSPDDASAEVSRTNKLLDRVLSLKALVVGGQVLFHSVDSAQPDRVLSLEMKLTDAIDGLEIEQLLQKPAEERDFGSLLNGAFLKAMQRIQKVVHQKLLPSALPGDGGVRMEPRPTDGKPSNDKPISSATVLPPRVPCAIPFQSQIPAPGMFYPDGNLIGPNHPSWGPTRPGGTLPGGAPGGVPGARFDPLGPLGPFGGEPDPDHLPRPGFRNDPFI